MTIARKLLLLTLSAFLCDVLLFAQTRKDQKEAATPVVDPGSSAAVYIPQDLDDCFRTLQNILTPQMIQEIKTGTEEDMARYHRGLGMRLRNDWGLWSGSRLKKYFNDLGVHHPDDMSGIILTSFWRHLNNKPIQLQEQISYYRRYWEDLKKNKEDQ